MIKNLLARFALYYCREILHCEYEAANIHRNTLLMGINNGMPLDMAAYRVVESLEIQIGALEALLGMPKDD